MRIFPAFLLIYETSCCPFSSSKLTQDESELEPQQQDVVQQAQPEQVTPTPAPAPAPQAQVPPAASAPAPASEEAPRKARPEPRREPKEGRDFQRPQRQHQPREHQPRERESREREPREQAAQIAPTGQSDQPFDFSSSSIEDFKKEQAAETDEKFYNKKSSFFDNISHSTRDQQRDPEQNRVNRELNMETFGQTESGFRNNNFRGGRGRGRGGRGRGGRGRGRGDGLSNRDRETFGGW